MLIYQYQDLSLIQKISFKCVDSLSTITLLMNATSLRTFSINNNHCYLMVASGIILMRRMSQVFGNFLRYDYKDT